MPHDRVPLMTSPVTPDLEAVTRFFHAMLARGAIAELLAAILALLTNGASRFAQVLGRFR